MKEMSFSGIEIYFNFLKSLKNFTAHVKINVSQIPKSPT